MSSATPVLSLDKVSKVYPGSKALSGVSLDIHAGEVLGLIGQNGAGKSTIAKILSGAIQPTEGRILIEGRPVSFAGPASAQRASIYTIYQEFSLVPELSVAENIYISDLPRRRGGFVHWRRMRELAAEAVSSIGFGHIDVDARVRSLSVAERQIVEIAKAVHHKSKVILLDEPTATLPRPDVDILFNLLRQLAKRGVSLLYITHHLDEVQRICDRVAILRNGRHVATHPIGEIHADRIVALMLGKQESAKVGMSARSATVSRDGDDGRTPAIEIRDLCDDGILKNVSVKVMPGESVAVTGLVGGGQLQLAACAFGAQRRLSGEVRVNGRAIRPNSPGAAVKGGLAWVPEERKTQGLVLGMSVCGNLTNACLDRVSRLAIIDRRLERRAARTMTTSLKIKAASLDHAVSTLSGGNQQKIVFGKWLLARSKAMILSDPTRGVDVGARIELYREIEDYVTAGGAALVVTSDIDEAMIFDRVLVMSRGEVVGEFVGGEVDQGELLSLLR